MQGLFGASLVPLSQGILLDIYSVEERGRAMALFGVSVMVGPVLGPVIGGWLTDNISWRWVFYINVPIGMLAFFGIVVFVSETKRDEVSAKLDWFGFGTLSLAIATLQLFLDRGEQLDWFSSAEIQIEALICAAAFYLFLVHTFTAKKSFVNPRLFLDRNFSVSMFFIFVIGVTYLASLALMTPYLQTLMGYPVITAGIVMGPRGVGTMVCMFIVGRLIGKVDTRAFAGPRLQPDRMGNVRHDRLDARRLAMDDRLRRLHPGRRSRLPVRAADDHRLCHPARANARRRHRPLQSVAQYRFERRHRCRHRADHRECRKATMRSIAAYVTPFNHAFNAPAVHAGSRSHEGRGPRRARRDDHDAGDDHRLYGRFQAADDHVAGLDPAGHAAAQACVKRRPSGSCGRDDGR